MTIYLDTSSLVKLYISESESDRVLATVARADVIVTSSISYAEVRATFARAKRIKELTPAEYAESRRRLDQDWPAFLTLDVTGSISNTAGDLADTHGLRGCDAIQLATFVQLLQGAEDEDVEFSSFDEQLNQAARSLG